MTCSAQRNDDDIRVLAIGVFCAVLIFSVVTIVEGSMAASVVHVDLVQVK